ncbi:hypothetical protein ACM0CU_24125 [Mycobacteroides abscessus subsp. abscessus]|uniref:hypothetical protein n=1 Tax=Mycobacteroides abscessus TaxID=36809 RepID=UPI0039EEB468
MDAATWAVVGRIIALLAVPHALVQAASKFVGISKRPRLEAAAKTMDVASYVTLAIVSALIVHLFGMQQHPTAADVDAASKNITLMAAMEWYVLFYCITLAGLAVVVIALKVAVHTNNSARYKWALGVVGLAVLAWWFTLLDQLKQHVDIPVHPPAIIALLFGPPILAASAAYAVRRWDRRSASSPAPIQ